MSLTTLPASTEQAALQCSHCGAQLAADQRYCLTCGQPCTPVRLAFLDTIQAERQASAVPEVLAPPPGYVPILPAETGARGWLQRQSGILAVIAAILTASLIGLLVGHWLAPAQGPATQVLKLEGALAGAPTNTQTTTSPQSGNDSTSATSKATEAQEIKEAKEAEAPTAKAPPPVKTSASGLQKLSKLKGKSYQKAVNKLVKGDQPIQTGG